MDTYIFRESATWKGKPTKKRRTFAFVGKAGRFGFGVSQCCAADQFNRKLGRDIALGRATKALVFNKGTSQEPKKRGELARIFLKYLKTSLGFRWEPRFKNLQQQIVESPMQQAVAGLITGTGAAANPDPLSPCPPPVDPDDIAF